MKESLSEDEIRDILSEEMLALFLRKDRLPNVQGKVIIGPKDIEHILLVEIYRMVRELYDKSNKDTHERDNCTNNRN